MTNVLPFEHGPDAPQCAGCGYVLRGVRSPECPECGKVRQRRIAYFDRDEFDAVRAALDHAGVACEFHDPRVGVIGMLTLLDGVNLCPVILLDWKNQPRAEEALENVGLSMPVALVDEREPFCPCCGLVLRRRDPSGGRCDVCATPYSWFESSHGHPDEFQADGEHEHAQSD